GPGGQLTRRGDVALARGLAVPRDRRHRDDADRGQRQRQRSEREREAPAPRHALTPARPVARLEKGALGLVEPGLARDVPLRDLREPRAAIQRAVVAAELLPLARCGVEVAVDAQPFAV